MKLEVCQCIYYAHTRYNSIITCESTIEVRKLQVELFEIISCISEVVLSDVLR